MPAAPRPDNLRRAARPNGAHARIFPRALARACALVLAPLLAVTLPACSTSRQGDAAVEIARIAQADPSPEPECLSLLGRPLHRPPTDPAREPLLRANLAAALADFERDPRDESAAIWVGRRLAYLGRFQDAVAVFSAALRIHPESHRLLRHRGHRWITLRRFDLAVADLARAWSLAQPRPDAIEPDGDPNPADIPLTTDKSNIAYHLGLALFLQGRYAESEAAFARRTALATFNDDMLVSTTHWRYLALRRLARHDHARALLEPIRPDLRIIENTGYHRLGLLYRGDLTPESLNAPGAGSPASDSVAFGVAAFLAAEGRHDRADALLRDLVARGHWASFGVIAAEADLARAADPR